MALVDVAVIIELGRVIFIVVDVGCIVIVVIDVGCVIVNMGSIDDDNVGGASTMWAVVDTALIDMGCHRRGHCRHGCGQCAITHPCLHPGPGPGPHPHWHCCRCLKPPHWCPHPSMRGGEMMWQ